MHSLESFVQLLFCFDIIIRRFLKMKKQAKRVLVMVVAIAMVGSSLTTVGTITKAKTTKAPKNKIAKELNDGSDAFDFSKHTGKAESRLKSKLSEAPSSYDLRNVDGKSYVTPVKFQNPFGTCWGFAAVATAESSILGSGLAEEAGYSSETLNFSEKHVVNNLVNPINDKNNSQNGEGMYFTDKNLSLTDKFNMGGLPVFASSMFSSGIGPVLEDSDVPEGVQPAIYGYHGTDYLTTKRKINGSWMNYCYSEKDDWSIPESLRFESSFQLKESYMLPSPAKVIKDDDGEVIGYEYNPSGTLAIKDQLLNKRAVSIGFCADTSRPEQGGSSQYISANWAHYTYNEDEDVNHAVTIVGWDDNYSKDNFLTDHQPPEDGAWLVKNSWGSGEEEFPNHGDGSWGIVNGEGKHTGYFWLSYYDKTISMPEALAFDKNNLEIPNNQIDQYDFMPVEDIEDTASPVKASTSNVFKAECTQQLEEIAFITGSPGTTVEYSVYVLPDGFDNPEDGIKVKSGQTEPYEYGGFHKLKLDSPVLLQKGQNYSIVITEVTADGEYNINIEMGLNEFMAEFAECPNYVKGIVNKNESFVNIYGKWHDYSDKDFLARTLGLDTTTMSIDNFPIKGYCTKRPNINAVFSSGTDLKMAPLGIKGTEEIRLSFEGDEGIIPDDSDISWEATSGSEKFFEMNKAQSDSTRVMVTPIKPGSGYIKVDIDGYGTQVIKVTVTKTGKFIIDEENYIDVGESNVPMITDPDGIEYDPDEYMIKSFNPDIVSVGSDKSLNGLKPGKAKCMVYDGNGAETEFYVIVRESSEPKENQNIIAKGKTVKVKYKALKKKKKTVKRKKYLKLSGTKGKVTYAIKSIKKKKFKKYFKINTKTGKLTIKKKLKKGKYKLKIRVRAAGNDKYKAATKTVQVVIIIK